MNIINKDIIYNQEINKSTFTTYLYYVEDVKDAKRIIEEVKTLHPNATHHVTCYIIGKSGEMGHANDDGEPSGTAALPILDVFKKNDVTNFVCIVVRYFGGIKLGAGGLIRAYSSSASLALKEAGMQKIIEYRTIKLTFAYSYLNLINQLLKDYTITNKDFTMNVNLTVKLPTNEISKLEESLIALTNNQIIIEK